jgi:single-strand DNA-binding protein
MINKATFIGRLTKDPELKYTPSGVAVANFTLAVDTGWGDNKKTYFPNFIAFKKTAENLSNLQKKGNLLYVEGQYQQRDYEKNGQKVYVHEFLANEIKYLTPQGGGQQQQRNTAGDGKPFEISDGDVPF